jgi:hypothetical protein
MSETSVAALRPNEYQLQFYDAGCRAIEQARSVDEVKSIADKSTAVRAYARQVHNFKLEADAWVIRNRAYAKMGKLMGALRAEERSASAHRPKKDIPTENFQKLEDLGVSFKESARATRLAEFSESDLEVKLAHGRALIEAGKKRSSDRMIDPVVKREPPPIDRIVAQTWRFWDHVREGKELTKLREIVAHKRHAEQAGIGHLKGSLSKVIDELEKIARRL